jgi:hypothetical protein
MTDHERLGRVESVVVDGQEFTGRVYHVRRNGWACIEANDRHIASGPAPAASPTREHVLSRVFSTFAH